MPYTHSNSLNRFGVTPLIVATDPANGSHTTLASALATAVSGQTVFLRDSVVENVTLPPGVNIASWQGSAASTPSIQGKLTMTGAGTSTISGVALVTNSDNFLAVTGSAASIINLNNCNLNCLNAGGITFSSSSSSSSVRIRNCRGNLGTTGIKFFDQSSAGNLEIYYSNIANSGGSTTSSTCSAGGIFISNSGFLNPITTSGTGVLTLEYSNIDVTNATALTIGGGAGSLVRFSRLASGTASAVSVGSTLKMNNCEIFSSNTNAITGSGTLTSSSLTFSSTSNAINTTTQAAMTTRYGIQRSTLQPAFSAQASTQSSVTGDGTNYVIIFATEIFDQNNNFDSVSTFTAPVTGLYQLNFNGLLNGVTVSNTSGIFNLVTSNRSNYFQWNSAGATQTSGVISAVCSALADMDTGDTAKITMQVSGSTKIISVNQNSRFNGKLAC